MSVLQRTCEALECVPPWIGDGVSAVAGACVEVLTAVGAEPLAVLFAERTAGQGEQHLLTHDVLKQQAVVSIIPYFSLVLGDGSFSGLGVRVFGAEEEVEGAFEWNFYGLEAAGAGDFKVSFIGGSDADVGDFLLWAAMFDDEIGFAVEGQGADLAGVDGIVDCAGWNGLVKDEGLFFEVERGDEHGFTVYSLTLGEAGYPPLYHPAKFGRMNNLA